MRFVTVKSTIGLPRPVPLRPGKMKTLPRSRSIWRIEEKRPALHPRVETLRDHYFVAMGWDPSTGQPEAQTLRALSIEPVLVGR